MQIARIGTFAATLVLSFAASVLAQSSIDWDKADPIAGIQFQPPKLTARQVAVLPAAGQPQALPDGRLHALPYLFTVEAKRANWTYPDDGEESKMLVLNASNEVTALYQWTPKEKAKGANLLDLEEAKVRETLSFPELRVDLKNRVVRLPHFGLRGLPASAEDAVIIADIVNNPSLPGPQVVLRDGYSLRLDASVDNGDAAYLHRRFDDDKGEWVGDDNSPAIKTVSQQVYLYGPGLDPACDADPTQAGCPQSAQKL